MKKSRRKITKKEFRNLMKVFGAKEEDFNFLYENYELMLSSYKSFGKDIEDLETSVIDHRALAGFLINDCYYRTSDLSDSDVKKLQTDEHFLVQLLNIVLDKYSSFVNFQYSLKEVYTFFDTPISSLNVFINFILNKLEQFNRTSDHKNLIIDLLTKVFLLCKTITSLLTSGFETEAFVTWRTLHETEAILSVLVKSDQKVANAYLRHMQYSLAYNKFFEKEVNDMLFVEIKAKMKELDLKSKDLKKFIEYGWLYEVSNINEFENFKLNFRDGLEKVAGLSNYNKLYQRASEFVHATPLTLIANKEYFGRVTLLCTYETFLRVEEIFNQVFVKYSDKQSHESYKILRKIYRSDLIQIMKKEQEKLQ